MIKSYVFGFDWFNLSESILDLLKHSSNKL